MLQSVEKALATILLASRWLMLPLYFGLIAALVFIVIVFFFGLFKTVVAFDDSGAGVILAILKLIDLILLGNLILILIGAGLDTILSNSGDDPRIKRPEWMGKTDFAALKLKILASIIAIAAIDLLETFFKVNTTDKSDVFWSIAIFLSFVVAGVLLALTDRLTAENHHSEKSP